MTYPSKIWLRIYLVSIWDHWSNALPNVCELTVSPTKHSRLGGKRLCRNVLKGTKPCSGCCSLCGVIAWCELCILAEKYCFVGFHFELRIESGQVKFSAVRNWKLGSFSCRCTFHVHGQVGSWGTCCLSLRIYAVGRFTPKGQCPWLLGYSSIRKRSLIREWSGAPPQEEKRVRFRGIWVCPQAIWGLCSGDRSNILPVKRVPMPKWYISCQFR